VADDTARRREYYLSKIKAAEELALKTSNADMLHDLETVIEGYRKLLARLPPATDSGH
jgi:hypothetical protein